MLVFGHDRVEDTHLPQLKKKNLEMSLIEDSKAKDGTFRFLLLFFETRSQYVA